MIHSLSSSLNKTTLYCLCFVTIFLSSSHVFAQEGSGNALSFNGSTDYVLIGDQPELESMTQLTVAAWIKGTNMTSDNVVVAKWYTATVSWILRIGSCNSGKAEFDTNTGSSVGSCGTTSVDDGNWHFIVGTYDGTNQRLYVDGVLEDTDAQTGTISNSEEEVCIGAACNGATQGSLFNGEIDDVRIWNRALSQAEIRDNMCEKLTGTEPNLVGYWNFNEGSGATASDASSSGNDGSLRP